MRLRRFLCLALAYFILAPDLNPMGLHVHAASGEGAYSGLSHSVTCSCDPITYPEMRQLFEEFQYRMTDETNNLHNTMVYNIGWGPDAESLKNFKVYADLMSGHHLVDWTYYQPKRIENEWRADLFRGDALRAFNVLGRRLLNLYEVEFPVGAEKPTVSPVYPAITTTSGAASPSTGEPESSDNSVTESEVTPDQTPIIQASNSSASVGETRGIRLNEKRSMIIMAIYKAIGVEFFNKPVVYSTLLGTPDKPAYRLVDTPFFKQMASADLKWNEYTVSNVDGHNYLFMDNNYLEAYLVKAVNDRVISQAELTPELISLIEKNYISRGSSVNGVVSAGTCEDYVLIDRNRGLGPGKSAPYEKDDLSIIYTFFEGNITYNPAFQAHQKEIGTTVLDFCKYAYQIMYSNGFPVISEQDRNALYSQYGAQWPANFSQEEIDALSYLIVHGIIPPGLTNTQILDQITTEDCLIYLSRISDPDTRLTYAYEVTEQDMQMASDGFAATMIQTTDIDSIPKDLSYTLPDSSVIMYDYYIQKDSRVVTVAPGTSRETKAYFSLDAPQIKPSWGKQLPDVLINGKKYMHYQLPVIEPAGYNVRYSTEKGEMYVLNSDDPKDRPLYVCVPPGGGMYQFGGEIADGSDMVPYLKKVTAPTNLPGNWEGRPVPEPSTVETNLPEMTKFAASTNRLATIKFEVGDYQNIVFGTNQELGSLIPAAKVDDPAGEQVTIGTTSVTIRVLTAEEGGYLVEIDVPEDQIDIVVGSIATFNSGVGYPAYINKGDGTVLVSEAFLQQCGLEQVARENGDYLTFRARSGFDMETTYVKSVNTLVSGSVIINFGERTALKENDANADAGSFYIDARVLANHLNYTSIFCNASGEVVIDATPTAHTTTGVHLWTSAEKEYQVAYLDSPNNIIMNTIPPAISNTMIMRHIDQMEKPPVVVQLRPLYDSARQRTASGVWDQFLGGNANDVFAAYDQVVYDEGTEITYDPESGYVTYEVPESYTQQGFYDGNHPFPYYMENGKIVQANIPLISHRDTAQPKHPDLTSSRTHNSDWKPFDTYAWATGPQADLLKNAFTGDLADVSIPAADVRVQYFPVGIGLHFHGLDELSVELGDLREKMLGSTSTQEYMLYFGGGYYTAVQEAAPSNIQGNGAVVFVRSIGRGTGENLDSDQITNNRFTVMSGMSGSPVQKEAYADTAEGRFKLPILSSSICVPVVSAVDTTVYISQFELHDVSLAGAPAANALLNSTYGDIFENALSILGAQSLEELHFQIRLRMTDDYLSVVYVALIRILPRILIASLFIIASLSLISNNYYFMWFCERLFDPVALFSFGIVKRTELNVRTIWFSVTLGIIFLALVNVGTVDVLYSYFFGQLLEIMDRVTTGNI